MTRLHRLLPAAAIAALFVVVSMATRLALAYHASATFEGGPADWLRIAGFGLLYDVFAAVYLVTPLVVWLLLVPRRFARTGLHRALIAGAGFAYAYLFVLIGVAEWLFWEEFAARFNFIAVDYLLYTHEVLGNIFESYPVNAILALLLVPAAAATAVTARRLWRASGAPLSWGAALASLALWGLLLAGSLQFLDSDLKDGSPQDAVNELAGNGPFQFFAANYRNELDYFKHYATVPMAQAVSTVRRAMGDAHSGWIRHASLEEQHGVERMVDAHGKERRLNVVLVSVESLGAEFLGAYGDTRGLTPNLDRLARESLWFSNMYATGNRTVRGLEALSLAVPPTPGQSIVRRPNNANLFTLGSVFEDRKYDVLFAYGGYGYFDNMNGYFGANNYRVVDRRAIASGRIEFENIWGVADEHLYDQVLEEADKASSGQPRKPFFVHVMTTSNHRPYTYPAGRIDIPSGSGREGAVKYTDYALGRLIERARKHAWFDDTLFVITADHGASARGTSRIPLDKYLIPLFIYAPKHIEARRVDRLMSQIDIPPTVLGLLNFSYYSKFLGRDLLHSPPESDRAFVGNYQALGYLHDNRMVVLRPKRKVEVLRLGPGGAVLGETEDHALRDEAISFYQVASNAFRRGLLKDEEQLPPFRRVAYAPR